MENFDTKINRLDHETRNNRRDKADNERVDK